MDTTRGMGSSGVGVEPGGEGGEDLLSSVLLKPQGCQWSGIETCVWVSLIPRPTIFSTTQ